jgi:hypothetical protein
LRIRSSEGQRKAFSTCGSHLTAVAVLWLPLLYVSETSKLAVCWARENCVSVLYFCESHAESIHLQPEKQWCKTGFEKTVYDQPW